jgi:hypothetical protein
MVVSLSIMSDGMPTCGESNEVKDI